ncbi:ArnT family glycosyltransferase [Hydrogenophaga sp. RWCD_12]|uniref:ArnT family glycosyltransferase n=1 Tax=Hydrogenophaga sp. RWCD_12 TaxID=3391190 RepID=UPI0039852181
MSQPTDEQTRRRTLFWLVATAIVLLLGIGLRYPWPADEPRFAQVAREMVESGQWLFPTRGGEPYPDKPPVFMWLAALTFVVTGQIKIAFLLPSALAAFGTVLLVHDIGRRLWNREVALAAVLVLVLTPQFLLQGKTGQIDALLCFWITLGCYGLLRHFFTGPHWGWYFTACAGMGVGIITKGVGFLPLLMLLPLGLWVKNPSAGQTGAVVWRWKLVAGLLVMLAVIALWLGPMLWQVHSIGTDTMVAYRNDLLFRQTGERFVNAWHHVKPWHYFFTQAIPTVWFPLVVLLLVFFKPLVALLRDDRRARVLMVWVGMVLLFFSLSSGKREVYMLPALPMLALVVGVLWTRVRESVAAARTGLFFQGFLVLLALVITGLGVVLRVSPEKLLRKAPDYAELIATLATPLMAMGLALLVVVVLVRRRDLLERLALATITVWVFVALMVWPRVDPHRTPQEMMEQVEQKLPPTSELALLYFKEQFLLFSHRPLTHFSYLAPLEEQERNAWVWMHEAPNRFLLVPTDAELACFDVNKAVSLGEAHRREWVLFGAESMRASCEPPKKIRRYVYRPDPRGVLP